MGSCISAFPESIGNCKSLTKLDLYKCPISALPESIGGCKSLTELNLQYRMAGSTGWLAVPDGWQYWMAGSSGWLAVLDGWQYRMAGSTGLDSGGRGHSASACSRLKLKEGPQIMRWIFSISELL